VTHASLMEPWIQETAIAMALQMDVITAQA